MVNAERPAAVVITGDLFDGYDRGPDRLAATFNRLNAPMGIYFITGNHETYVGVARAEEALRRTKVRVLNNEMVTFGGLQIVGIAYPDRGEHQGTSQRPSGTYPGLIRPRRLSCSTTARCRYPRSERPACGCSYPGTHQGQLFPFQFIARRVYGKYDHGLNVEDDFTIYTSPGG